MLFMFLLLLFWVKEEEELYLCNLIPDNDCPYFSSDPLHTGICKSSMSEITVFLFTQSKRVTQTVLFWTRAEQVVTRTETRNWEFFYLFPDSDLVLAGYMMTTMQQSGCRGEQTVRHQQQQERAKFADYGPGDGIRITGQITVPVFPFISRRMCSPAVNVEGKKKRYKNISVLSSNEEVGEFIRTKERQKSVRRLSPSSPLAFVGERSSGWCG
jgi:hypothetical protein